MERICRGLADALELNGRAALYVEYPKIVGQDYLARVRSWLSDGRWGLAFWHVRHYTTLEYVAGHTSTHLEAGADFQRWMEHYEREQIVGMGRECSSSRA